MQLCPGSTSHVCGRVPGHTLPGRPETVASPKHLASRGCGSHCRQGHRLRAAPAGAGSEGQSPTQQDVQRLLNTVGQQHKIGSEHGEGFVQFRVRGEPVHLDVDRLNEQLQAAGKNRLRQFMRPDEGLGVIISFDNVVADLRALQRAAWLKVASDEGLPFPRLENHVYDITPERAIMQVLQWTQDRGAAQRLAWRVAEALAQELQALQEPQAGARDWLAALASASVPCACVSSLDRSSLNGALERMGIAHAFVARITAEDGMDTHAQQFLAAAIQLQRAPNRCVAFAACPLEVTAAHNCTMKAVAVQGTYPAWKLRQADVTCSSLSELTVYNLRRLFAYSGQEFMDTQKQIQAPPKRLRAATVGLVDP